MPAEAHFALAAVAVAGPALVCAKHAQVGEAVWSLPQHEYPLERSRPFPVLQFVGSLDFSDPNVVLMPLGGYSVRRGAQSRENVREQLARLRDPLGPAAVHRKKTELRRRARQRRVHIELVDGS